MSPARRAILRTIRQAACRSSRAPSAPQRWDLRSVHRPRDRWLQMALGKRERATVSSGVLPGQRCPGRDSNPHTPCGAGGLRAAGLERTSNASRGTPLTRAFLRKRVRWVSAVNRRVSVAGVGLQSVCKSPSGTSGRGAAERRGIAAGCLERRRRQALLSDEARGGVRTVPVIAFLCGAFGAVPRRTRSPRIGSSVRGRPRRALVPLHEHGRHRSPRYPRLRER